MTQEFTQKCILPSKRVCIRLKAAREAAGLSISDIETKTKIHKKYLTALEECRFEDLKHSPVYQKNFIKKYVCALGEDPKPFLQQFTAEELHDNTPCHHPHTHCKKSNFSDLPYILRFLGVACVVGVVLAYLGLHIHNILRPPALTVNSPSDGLITYESMVIITGKTDPETRVTVNEEVIKNDEQGNFEQQITLTPGINTLVIEAQNKHGKISEQTCHVIYKNILGESNT